MEAAPAGIWRGLLFLEVPVREKGDKKGPFLDCFFFHIRAPVSCMTWMTARAALER